MFPLFALPNDLLGKVFDQLEYKDLTCVMGVCKRFYEITTTDDNLWVKFTLILDPRTVEEYFLTSHNRRFESICLTNEPDSPWNIEYDNLRINPIVESLSRDVKYLTLYNHSFKITQLIGLIRRLPNLVSANSSDCIIITELRRHHIGPLPIRMFGFGKMFG